jgi:hypothetical protein
MKFNPIEKKDVEAALAKDSRKPLKFFVRYYTPTGTSYDLPKRTEYANLDQINFKRGVTHLTIQFEDGPMIWHQDCGKNIIHNKKKIKHGRKG